MFMPVSRTAAQVSIWRIPLYQAGPPSILGESGIAFFIERSRTTSPDASCFQADSTAAMIALSHTRWVQVDSCTPTKFDKHRSVVEVPKMPVLGVHLPN